MQKPSNTKLDEKSSLALLHSKYGLNSVTKLDEFDADCFFKIASNILGQEQHRKKTANRFLLHEQVTGILKQVSKKFLQDACGIDADDVLPPINKGKLIQFLEFVENCGVKVTSPPPSFRHTTVPSTNSHLIITQQPAPLRKAKSVANISQQEKPKIVITKPTSFVHVANPLPALISAPMVVSKPTSISVRTFSVSMPKLPSSSIEEHQKKLLLECAMLDIKYIQQARTSLKNYSRQGALDMLRNSLLEEKVANLILDSFNRQQRRSSHKEDKQLMTLPDPPIRSKSPRKDTDASDSDAEIICLIYALIQPRSTVQYPPTAASTTEELAKQKEQEFLFKYRNCLIYESKIFTKVLLASIECANRQSMDAHKVLDQIFSIVPANTLEALTIEDALELLMSKYLDIVSIEVIATSILERYTSLLEFFLMPIVQSLRNLKLQPISQNKSKLVNFLTDAATNSLSIANKLHWLLIVEIAAAKAYSEQGFCSSAIVDIYSAVSCKLAERLAIKNSDRLKLFSMQEVLVDEIHKISADVKNNPEGEPLTRHQKMAKLRTLLKTRQPKWAEIFQNGFCLPMNSTKRLYGFVNGSSKIFKSAQEPLGLAFQDMPTEKILEPSLSILQDPYFILFKQHDDLRQDQLVLHMFEFMDRILRFNGVDMNMSPFYKVVATGLDSGMLEIVPHCSTIAGVLEKHGSIHQFLQKCATDLKVDHEVILNTYIRSFAGYSVLTYLLGVGDRHLDNILITNHGRLFHIDYGFFLGKDPKPFPPLMRITNEMIGMSYKYATNLLDGLGGLKAQHYVRFQVLCCQAFKILRRYANLILMMLYCMSESRCASLVGDPSCIKKVVERNFRLDLSNEEADSFMLETIQSSLTSWIPMITETFHKLAQSWRD